MFYWFFLILLLLPASSFLLFFFFFYCRHLFENKLSAAYHRINETHRPHAPERESQETPHVNELLRDIVCGSRSVKT